MVNVILFVCWIILGCVGMQEATNPCPSPPCLFYTYKTTINSVPLSPGASLSTVKSSLGRAAAIAVDFRRQMLFWSDFNRYVIQSLNLTTGHSQDVVTSGIIRVKGMSVDWENGLIYWTDYSRREINVATYDGVKRKTLINAGVVKPQGIAVDPRNGIMFWTDLGSKPRIQRATLSGHNQTTIVNLSPLQQRWPHGITIDYTNNRLYWIDNYQDEIMSVDFNGKNITLHRSFYNVRAFSLDMYGDFLYFSDSVGFRTKIRTVDKNHGGDARVFHDVDYSNIMGISIYDQSRQPRGNTSCVQGNSCQYLCLQSPHGPQCACPDGNILNKDFRTCRESAKSILLTKTTGAIYRIPLEDPQPVMKRVPLAYVSSPNTIGVDPINRRLYWSDIWQQSISRAFLDGTFQQRIVGMERTPDGLAVDWVAGNLYWTDMIANKIEVAKLDGKFRKTLVYKNLEYPISIVLDLVKGYLYWGSRGGNASPKIEKADMAGQNRLVLANLTQSAWPIGITIFENRLYWIDKFRNLLQYVDRVTPRGVVTRHLSAQIAKPLMLASLGEFLYLLDKGQYLNDGSVIRIDKDNGRILQRLIWNNDRPLAIAAVDFNVTLTTVSHSCSQSNGNCTHLCLLEPNGQKCACPNEMALKDDGKTCYYKEFLMYADAGYNRRGIYKLLLDDPTPTPERLSFLNIQRPTALDYDPLERFVYWTDVSLDRIIRGHLDGSSQAAIISSGLRSPQGLAVDAMGRNLYWTDMRVNVIEVSKLDGSSRKVLVSNLDEPKAIVLDGKRGYMYWSSWGDLAKIECADMDGKNRTLVKSFPNGHLRNAISSPIGLALDLQTNLLYWIDKLQGTLQYIDLKTRPYRVQNLISSHLYLSRPFGLVVNEEYIYWSLKQGSAGGIFRVEKENGNTVKRIASTSRAPRDLHVYHNVTAIPDSHPCSIYNGWCTHLCLIVPGGYKCACPTVTTPDRPCLTVPNHSLVTSSTSTTTIPSSTPRTVWPTTGKQRTTPSTTRELNTIPTSKNYTIPTASTPESSSTPESKQTAQKPPRTISTHLSTRPTQIPCLSNPCHSNGKCIKSQNKKDGFFCQCEEGYASKLCDVYYGKNKIDITFQMKLKDWKTTEFKVVMARLLNQYCEKNDCQAKYNRRKRRSRGLSDFTSDDIIVVGDPKIVFDGIEVQTVVLEPQQQNLLGSRKTLSGSLLCAIMRDTKESQSNAILKGYNILALNGEKEPECPAAARTGTSKGNRSGHSGSAISVPAAGSLAAVCGLCLLILVIVAFYIHRRKQHQSQKEEKGVRPNAIFSNPGFLDDAGAEMTLSNPTYEEISPNLRDEILGINDRLPLQEGFSDAQNLVYGLERDLVHGIPRPLATENKMEDDLRVIMKPEDNGRDGNHWNSRNGEGTSHGNLRNSRNSESDKKEDRYVTLPPLGFHNRYRHQNPRDEPEYASIPTCGSGGRPEPRMDVPESEYASIPGGRFTPRGMTNQNSYDIDRDTEAENFYGKVSSAEKRNKPHPRLGPPPEVPTLIGTYMDPECLDGPEAIRDNRIYVNVVETTKPSLDNQALHYYQGNKHPEGQEETKSKDPEWAKGTSSRRERVKGTDGNNETSS